jgi:archaemetzincin
MMSIILLPIGDIEPKLLEFLQKHLIDELNCSIKINPKMPIPQNAYNELRKQYHSTTILSKLTSLNLKAYYLLGIIDRDLYVPELNFVFGEALPANRVAIISLTRLRQSFYGLSDNKDLFYLRALKEAMHELGHLYGLWHCPDRRCVMHFSNSIYDTDYKSYKFCKDCKLFNKLLRESP